MLVAALMLTTALPVGAQAGPTWQDVPDPGQKRIEPEATSTSPPTALFVGEFTLPGIGGEFIDVVDIDNDGDNDLVTADGFGAGTDVRVYTGNNGDYTLSDTTNFADGTGAGLTLVGKLNGDSLPDVVVITSTGFQVAMRQAGGYMAATSYTGSKPIQLADIDGDGDLDVIGKSQFWRNDGSGGFGAFEGVVAGVWYGDVDGDGLADVIDLDPEGYPNQEVMSVAYGTGGGNHDPYVEVWVSFEEEHPTGLFFGDQDKDGTNEIYIPTDLEWREGDHFYRFVTAEDDGGGFESYRTDIPDLAVEGWVRDLDGDGDRDILMVSGSTIIVQQAVTGGFEQNEFSAQFDTFATPRLADFNDDGVPDIVDIRTNEVVYALGVDAASPGTLTVDIGKADMCVDVMRSGVGTYTGESAETGSAGTVTFDLPSGHYDLFVWDCSFESTGVMTRHPYAWQTVKDASGAHTGPGVLVNPNETTVADVQLELGAIYSGTVTDIRSGAAIARITVGTDSDDFSPTKTETPGTWSWVGVPQKDVPEFVIEDLEGFYFEETKVGPTAEVGKVYATVDQALDGRLVDARDNIFAQDVIWIADAGITKGCESTGYLYCPGNNISRGQMAAFLVRTLGLTVIDPTISFDDIDGNLFEADILKLATAGITAGCNADGSDYCPGDPVKRGQMAAFLVRAFELTESDPTISFTDTSKSIFEADIIKLATAEVTFGCNAERTEYCPAKEVTRGQMAAFIRRAVEGST